jgi:hypothetical protein
VHSLSTSFVLGYHGCDRGTGERLLLNQPFRPSENSYDWLGSGIYFWEANPTRALEWARQRANRPFRGDKSTYDPFVVGAVIDPGFCLDLTSSSGIHAVQAAYENFQSLAAASGARMPENIGGADYLLRNLDCAVINFLHRLRDRAGEQPFDTVRGVFVEGSRIYTNSGFREKTHIQICVRNSANIHGVFRVHDRYFSHPNTGTPNDE